MQKRFLDDKVIIIGNESILQKSKLKVYINARYLKSLVVMHHIVTADLFEEMYIMCDGMAFDSLKKWTQTNTAFNTLYYISSAELQSNYLCSPYLGIIINSRIAKPNRLYCLQNVSVYFQVLQSNGINVIGEFLNFIYDMPNIRVLEINSTREISVTCDVLSAAVKTIAANPNLECVNISDNLIDDSDFSKVAEKLKYISSLKSINISTNQISV